MRACFAIAWLRLWSVITFFFLVGRSSIQGRGAYPLARAQGTGHAMLMPKSAGWSSLFFPPSTPVSHYYTPCSSKEGECATRLACAIYPPPRRNNLSPASASTIYLCQHLHVRSDHALSHHHCTDALTCVERPQRWLPGPALRPPPEQLHRHPLIGLLLLFWRQPRAPPLPLAILHGASGVAVCRAVTTTVTTTHARAATHKGAGVATAP